LPIKEQQEIWESPKCSVIWRVPSSRTGVKAHSDPLPRPDDDDAQPPGLTDVLQPGLTESDE
jgi:hypothetical protein